LDRTSNLLWESVSPKSGLAWAEAQTRCNTLSLAGTGWRLPSLKELQSLIDLSNAQRLNPKIFPDETAAWYWSATPSAQPGRAWSVEFFFGDTTEFEVSRPSAVRCVR
jgi:hypothetical protein